MKSYHVHYINKYPGGRVHTSDNAIDVFCSEGRHRVALRKNGAGQWVDAGDDHGAEDAHDLSPIPKEARYFKLFGNGKVGPAEEHDARRPKADAWARQNDGRVPSQAELEASAAAAEAAKAAKASSK